MKDAVDQHQWVIRSIVSEALQQVFKPKEDVLERLLENSPFIDLAVEEHLQTVDPARPNDKAIDAKRRIVTCIKETPLHHPHGSAICALNAFVATLRQQFRPHGVTSSVAVTA